MKLFSFSLPASLLSAAVDFAGGGSESRNTLPILTHLLIRSQNDRLSVVGTNLEIEMEYRIDMDAITLGKDTDASDILLTLPCKKLKDLLKTAPSEAVVTLTQVAEYQFAMTFSGLRSRFTLQTLPPESFPSIDSTTTGAAILTVDAQSFFRSLSTVTHAMANNDVRYYLNGLQVLGNDNNMTMTATDGHRLSQNQVAYSAKADTVFNALLPRAAVLLLPSVLKGATGDLTLAVTSNHILAKIGNGQVERVMKSKQIDGRFPDWRRVIPKTSQQSVTIDRNELVSSLKRAAILANEKYRGVKLAFNNNVLTVESRNSESEEAKEEVTVQDNTTDLEVGVNVDYLLTALHNHAESHIRLNLGDSVTSMVLTPTTENGMLDVIMPMRI